MLRKLIKTLIPNKGDLFFSLFEESAITAHTAAKNFVDILNSKDDKTLATLLTNSKNLKQKSNEINKRVLQALSVMFITPLDRGDIQELSNILNKLTKRILKLSTKLKIYNIDANSDDCLIKNANTLLIITKALVSCLNGLKTSQIEKINSSVEQINELEENGIEDFRHAINEMYSGKFDTLMILKLKEIYKSIDAAIELSVSASDLIMQVSVKSI